MALYAIGDIHGCLTALETIFNQGIIKSEDTVVFLGDYVDHGINTNGTLDWLIENQKNYNFKFLKGNHEIFMHSARESPEKTTKWLESGGAPTLASYGIESDENWIDNIDPEHWEFIDHCLPYLSIDDYIFIHAGLEPGKDLDAQDDFHLFWKKYETPEVYDPNKTVICGHTSRKNGEIADFGHTICIDTYAYGGMWLTCLNVETRTYLKANNKGQTESGAL